MTAYTVSGPSLTGALQVDAATPEDACIEALRQATGCRIGEWRRRPYLASEHARATRARLEQQLAELTATPAPTPGTPLAQIVDRLHGPVNDDIAAIVDRAAFALDGLDADDPHTARCLLAGMLIPQHVAAAIGVTHPLETAALCGHIMAVLARTITEARP